MHNIYQSRPLRHVPPLPPMAAKGAEKLLECDFLIVGGGIAGLAVSYVLAEAGHRVRVIEKRGLGVPAGGLRVPPNLSKILSRWVGPEELWRTAVRCVGTPWLDLYTGEKVGYLHWRPQVMTETGGDFILMHHADVHRILYNLAISAGVRVDLNTSVTSIHQGTASLPNPSVTLSTGEVVTADFLLGADGPRSMVRKVVLGREDDAKLSFLTVYTTAIPASEMNKDPELREYLKADEWRIWMGANRSICGHPMSARQAFHLHIYSHTGDQDPPTGNDETWEEVVPLETVAIGTHAPCYLSSVQRLLKMAPFLLRTRMMERPNGVEDWVDETGRIILIGEAAHPWQPGGTHGASIAVEDAVVFGSLFCRLSTWNQVPSFLSAYQELRQARCDAVKQGDISNAKLVAMPPGPAQDARNTDMRMQTTDQWDEGTYKDNFDEMAEIFGYDATDAADEWWVNWGRFSDTTRESPNIKHMSFGFTTTTVETEPHE